MESEAKLQSQLLDLLDTVQGTYKTRYLQAFDEVTGKCEQVVTEIDNWPDSRTFKAIAEPVLIDALACANAFHASRTNWRPSRPGCSSHRLTAMPPMRH